MNTRQFKISHKIAIGFAVVILAIVIIFVFTRETLSKAKKANEKIVSVHTPAISNLKNLKEQILLAQSLTKQIAYKQTKKNDRKRIELINLLKDNIPETISTLDSTRVNWNAENRQTYEEAKAEIAELIGYYWDILTLLPDFESYTDLETEMKVYDFFLEGQPVVELPKEIQKSLESLIANHQHLLKLSVSDMNKSFNILESRSLLLMFATIFIGILIAYIVIRSITTPVGKLKNVMEKLSIGIYPTNEINLITENQKDEIGEMAGSIAKLVDTLKTTKEFTMEVGRGNFDVHYEPVSKYDELGFALIKMRNELANSERVLEQQVEERTAELVVERKKATELYRNLTDSIDYAKRIQQSFLTPPGHLKNLFHDAFVLDIPKDKVSGDFFWVKDYGDKVLVAAVDCTGHGVPGAFVSMVANHVLTSVTKLFSKPSEILDILHVQSTALLRSGLDSDKKLMDGMDISLCLIDKNALTLAYAGAINPVFIIRDNQLIELKGDRFSIGSEQAYENRFTNQNLELKEGDAVYIFSDGFADQFGGPKSKKYFIKRFRKKLLEISHYDMDTQKHFLLEELKLWKGANEQTDDILVIGIRI